MENWSLEIEMPKLSELPSKQSQDFVMKAANGLNSSYQSISYLKL